ncbi:MAG: hypothetical protein K5776_03435 [Lachnospiraceae bacterium]|nr:hypothetical protein [Lachnospiraceae bacterium]
MNKTALVMIYFLLALESAKQMNFVKDNINISAYDTPVLVANKSQSDIKEFKSAQSMALNYNASIAFVMLAGPDENQDGINDSMGMAIYASKTNGIFTEMKVIHGLEKGHANGATYYEDNGESYVVVAPPITDSEYSLIRYKMDMKRFEIVETDYIPLTVANSLVKNIRSVSYDREDEAFYVSNGTSIMRFDKYFNGGYVIRSKKVANQSPIGTEPGATSFNQDGTVYGEYFYGVVYYTNSFEKYSEIGLRKAQYHSEKKDSVIAVYDKYSGDFKNFIILDSDEVKGITSVNYYDSLKYDMVELEDVEFYEDKMYLLYQKKGNFQILIADKPDVIKDLTEEEREKDIISEELDVSKFY